MKMKNLGTFAGAVALLVAGCGDDSTTQDMATAPDQSVAADMTVAPDMAVAPDMTAGPDMAKTVYKPTVLIEELAFTTVVGGNPVKVRSFTPVVINGDPAKSKPSDYDMTDMIGLGCSANHYDIAGGDLPTTDASLGTVSLTGYVAATPLGGMAKVDATVNCAIVNGFYACAYGPLVNGMPGSMSTNTTVFPDASLLVPAGTAINVKYTGSGVAGTYDSMMALKSTDPLTVTDDVTKVKYDPAADTTLHFTCDNKPQNCFDAVLVQLVASSVAPGMPGFPGADYGTINCAGLANSGEIKIPKEAITAMYGGSNKIVSVMTRIVRGALPPANQTDSNGNPVRLALGRGAQFFVAR